ncbi:MAG TPA: HNH endonuclease [Gemmatimonadaceae bacterium]
MSASLDFDARLRLAVFDHVEQLRRAAGGLVSARDLNVNIEFEGRQIPIWNQQRGIYRPAVLGPSGAALTIVTTAPRPGKPAPYDDHIGEDDDWIAYRYRGTDPSTFDNMALRRAGELQRPLLYLVGIRPGIYDPLFPAYIVADDPSTLTAHVSIGAPLTVHEPRDVAESVFALERRYHTVAVKQRLHQRKFRELVLNAYKERCAMCSLGHTSLLDAAHILEDRDERGRPEVPNGVALCKIHHSAYDANILGISPDYLVHVREAVLAEHDGPMLRYGLQALQHQRIQLPRAVELRPRLDYLADRFERFRAA